MKIIITHALTHSGAAFHKQKLYHVPKGTAREIASDFEAFKKNADGALACKTYDYVLDPPQTGAGDSAEGPGEANDLGGTQDDTGPETRGILTIDFRTVASVQGYDRLS